MNTKTTQLEAGMVSPVELVKTGSKFDSGIPMEGIALCLSGGGYRAMLFHLGALIRLNELGYLPKIDRISSVSGGSILAGMLGLKWSKLDFDENGVGQKFSEELVAPIRGLAGRTIDAGAILGGALGPGSIGEKVIAAYDKYLYGGASLQELPDSPQFVINSTNVQSGVLWRFMKSYMADYRVGKIEKPMVPLSVAVAASSAFPPFLSPVKLELDESQFEKDSFADLQFAPYTTDVYLSDGGVYDNLGLETAWKKYDTILVSDGGGAMKPEAEPKLDWARHTYRTLSLIDNQVRALRKRQVIGAYKLRSQMLKENADRDDKLFKQTTRKGTYWGIRSDIANYKAPDSLDCPEDKTLALADTATRLKRMEPELQEKLMNWGYAICDSAMRKHVDDTLPAPGDFPFPAAGIG